MRSGATPSAGAGLGAVAYVNMLPYFHLGNVPLFPTPRALNEHARAGKLVGACTSAIAGLRAGWRPLVPLHGIGAEGEVRSVYIEPILLGDPVAESAKAVESVESVDWKELPDRLAGSMPKGARALPTSILPAVTLFTSGASEHSEWLACVLLKAVGHTVHVVREPALAGVPEETLQRLIRDHAKTPLAALLLIGDPALFRGVRLPAAPRFDLAQLWRAATGLPCVFAVWFDCRPTERLDTRETGAPFATGESVRVVEVLHENLRAWECLSSAGRRERIAWFLASQGANAIPPGLSIDFEPLSFFESYLEGITCRFDASFAATLKAYEQLLLSP